MSNQNFLHIAIRLKKDFQCEDCQILHRSIEDPATGQVAFFHIGTKAEFEAAHKEHVEETAKHFEKFGKLAEEMREIKENAKAIRHEHPLAKFMNHVNYAIEVFAEGVLVSAKVKNSRVERIRFPSGCLQSKPIEEIEVNDPIEVKPINFAKDWKEDLEAKELYRKKMSKAIIKNHFERVHPGPKEIVEVPSGIQTVQEVTNSSFIGFQSGKDKYYAVENNNAFSLTKPYQLKLCAVMFRKRSLRELASTMIKSKYKVYSFTTKEELILWLKN